MNTRTKIKDPSVVEPTCWACFFGTGHRLAGCPFCLPTLSRARWLRTFRGLYYPCRRLFDGWEGAGFLPLSTVTSLFLPSFDCDFPFSPSFVPSFLLPPILLGLTPATMGQRRYHRGTSAWCCLQSPDVMFSVIHC